MHEIPKFDIESNARKTKRHIERIVADVAPGTEMRDSMIGEARMTRQIDETKEAEGRYITIDEAAEDMRTGRIRDALLSMQMIREREGKPPTHEEIKKITEDIRMAKFIRNDVDIEAYQGEIKRFLKETAGSEG